MDRVFYCVFRRKRSGVLYFRYAVPTKLRPVLNRREIKRSLQTTDKAVAIPKAMRLYADLQLQGQQMSEKRTHPQKHIHPNKASDQKDTMSESDPKGLNLSEIEKNSGQKPRLGVRGSRRHIMNTKHIAWIACTGAGEQGS